MALYILHVVMMYFWRILVNILWIFRHLNKLNLISKFRSLFMLAVLSMRWLETIEHFEYRSQTKMASGLDIC
jgi:hypothetical protein